MERFQRHDPATHLPMEVQILDTEKAGDYWDQYRLVRLLLNDGRHLETAFWRDGCQRGGHWVEEPGMVIVQDLTTEAILAGLDYVLREGAVEQAFEPMRT